MVVEALALSTLTDRLNFGHPSPPRLTGDRLLRTGGLPFTTARLFTTVQNTEYTSPYWRPFTTDRCYHHHLALLATVYYGQVVAVYYGRLFTTVASAPCSCNTRQDKMLELAMMFISLLVLTWFPLLLTLIPVFAPALQWRLMKVLLHLLHLAAEIQRSHPV